MEGCSFARDFEGKVSCQGMHRRQFWKQVSLSIEALLGNLGGGGGPFTGNFEI